MESINITKRNRRLEKEQDVFAHNAWDDIEWSKEMLDEAKRRVEVQVLESKSRVISVQDIESQTGLKWNEFYQAHGDKFFKDRRWIFSEFPELMQCLKAGETGEACNVFEVGCGVGNAVKHLIECNNNPNLHIYCCDLSLKAIETLKKRQFEAKHCQTKLTAFQANICEDMDSIVASKLKPRSVDYIMLIFVLSALKPSQLKNVVGELAKLLKPGGAILFRDYGQYDLAQLRFKGGAYLSENYYMRADGTTSYFFTTELVDELFASAGLTRLELKDDNRLLVNRSKAITMCRRWVQAKYVRGSPE